MAAGTAYSKRYAGGFADGSGGGTPIDSTFLNAEEAALLQLIGVAPTADGQVAQWDFANTRFGPALLLNKNIDPAAAIAKSKLDFTGANGIVNADIAGGAAIAKSKLAALGIVDADVAVGAAIARSKIVSVSLTTSVPGSPSDGDQILYTDSVTVPTYVWLMQWSLAVAKWLFLGGSPQFSEVVTSETTASVTYAALATAGPSLTLVRAGDYHVTIGCQINVGGNINALMSYDIGGTGAVDADAIQVSAPSATVSASVSRQRLKTGITAGLALVSKYKVSSGTIGFQNRYMSIIPRSFT